jgi:hypothetical protein
MELVAAVVLVALLCTAAPAGIILSTPPPAVSGPGLGFGNVAAVITVLPNNDNVPAQGVLDNNVTIPLKRFDFPDYIDIEFTVASTDGVTEYQVNEFVDNNTGVPWGSYHMILGSGTGPNFAISPLNDGLDFDTGPPGGDDTQPTSGAFANYARPDEDQLVFFGGAHSSGAQPYSFRIDVPDRGTFTLRQIPIVIPEPGTIMLTVLAFAGLALRRCRGN